MRAGSLNKRLTIQTRSESLDSTGQNVIKWTPWATVWGQIEPLKGKEYFDAQKVTSEVSHRITIRYRQGLDSTMGLKYQTRQFVIMAILNAFERNKMLQIMAREMTTGEPG